MLHDQEVQKGVQEKMMPEWIETRAYLLNVALEHVKKGSDDMIAKLHQGMNLMTVFGTEFAEGSFCWMMENGELWLSMIIVKEEHRSRGVLHRLLDAAKEVSDHVIIPEPMNVVPITATKHGYVAARQFIEDYGEYIDTMEWKKYES